MLLKGKIRLPNTIVPRFPDRIKPPEKKKKEEEDDDHDEGREEEELRTFQVGGGGGGEERSEGEIWPDDGDENWTVLRAHHRIKIDIGREVSWDKRSDLEFEVASFLLTFLVLSCRLSMGFSFGPLISLITSSSLMCFELLFVLSFFLSLIFSTVNLDFILLEG